MTTPSKPWVHYTNNRSKVYGVELPMLTATYAGFVNGDTPASLTTQPTLTTTAKATISIGHDTVTPGGAVATNVKIRSINQSRVAIRSGRNPTASAATQ